MPRPLGIVCGLDVYSQVTTHPKLSSSAASEFGATLNSQVSMAETGLHFINQEGVALADRTELGLNAQTRPVRSGFGRRINLCANPKQGCQIGQFAHPIAGAGEIKVTYSNGSAQAIGITRLEQDVGNPQHDQRPTKNVVGLDRSGNEVLGFLRRPSDEGRAGESNPALANEAMKWTLG